MGLNLNRYRLAQQSPINEAKSISIDGSVIEIFNPTREENIAEIRNLLKEGIYFLGFDESHVGYIHKEGSDLNIIHSNFLGKGIVETELIENLIAFVLFNRFYIAEISTNSELLKI